MLLRDPQFYHQCDLTQRDETDSEHSKNKTLQYLIKIYTVNEDLCVTQQYLKSKALIREEKERHLRKYPTTIHPFSTLTLCWDSLMIIVFTIAFIRAPLMFFDYLKYYRSSTIDLTLLFVINWFCLIDIIFRLFQGLVTEHDNVSYIELNLGRIFFIYMKGTLIFDILSTIPFLIIQFMMQPDSNDLWQTTFRFMSILKLARINDYQNYLRRFLEHYHVSDNKTDVILLCITSFIIFHQFIGLQLLPGIVAIKFFGNDKDDFWYEDPDFRDRNMTSQFIICMYRSVCTLFGTGFLDFQPRNIYDKIFLSFMCVFGNIIRIVLFVKIMEKLMCMQSHWIKYEEIMNQIHKYVRHKKLPTKIREKFKKFYEFHYRGSYFPEEKIEQCVSNQLRQDILMHNTRVLTEQVSFFSNLSTSVFLSIVSRLHREVVLEGEKVFGCGEIGEAMYFVASGSLAMFSPSGIEIGHVTEGQYFGEVALVMENELRILTIVALETCELYRLDREDFDRVIPANPNLLQEIEKKAIERYNNMRLAEQEFRRRLSDGFEAIPITCDTNYDGLTRSPKISALFKRRSSSSGGSSK